MEQVDMVNHPPHYAVTPEGVSRECIEFTRNMPFSQGNAFKYVYRLGNKANSMEDLNKALFYLDDALVNGPIVNLGDRQTSHIDPCTDRTAVLRDIATGELDYAYTMLMLIKTTNGFEYLDRRYDTA